MALVADFRERFGCHPDDLPANEAELLAQALINDPTSRCWAAMSDMKVTLDFWLQLRLVALMSSALDAKFEIPMSKPESKPAVPVTSDDQTQAEALLARHGARIVTRG